MEQKETKSRICATFNKTMTLIQELQKETDLEVMLSVDWLDLYNFNSEFLIER